jgi:hypothetical protein
VKTVESRIKWSSNTSKNSTIKNVEQNRQIKASSNSLNKSVSKLIEIKLDRVQENRCRKMTPSQFWENESLSNAAKSNLVKTIECKRPGREGSEPSQNGENERLPPSIKCAFINGSQMNSLQL